MHIVNIFLIGVWLFRLLSKDLASSEQNKSHIASELRKREQQLVDDEEKFFNVCGSQDLEHDLSKLQDDLEKVFKQRGEWNFLFCFVYVVLIGLYLSYQFCLV